MSESLKKVRTEELRVKVTPEMKKRIDRIADLHGMPAVTWANHIIAKAVVDLERQYQLQNKTVEAMIAAMMPAMEKAITEAPPLGPEAAQMVLDAIKQDSAAPTDLQ